jgi:hypothetical protein
MNPLPIKIQTYVTAIHEATEISLKVNVPIYVFRILEGGYCIDSNAEVYSNEHLIMKIFKGQAI